MKILTALASAFLAFGPPAGADSGSPVEIRRLPEHGIKPSIAVDEKGVIHAVYFTGDTKAGNALYSTSKDGGTTWAAGLRVNSQPGSVLGVSRARGPRMALGRGGRIHVLWLGSDKAEPHGNPDKASASGTHNHVPTPLLYTRLDTRGERFEPQRALLRHATGLDGDCAIAADRTGHVFAVVHAKEPGEQGEAKRGVFVAASSDDGATFAEEKNILPKATGVCACCALTAQWDDSGRLVILYRQARDTFERGMNMLSSKDGGTSYQLTNLDQWHLAACPMSVPSLLPARGSLVAAWENNGQITWGIPGGELRPLACKGGTRKGPSLAVNARGESLIAWTEDTSFAGGGSVVWQLHGADGQPNGVPGRRDDLPPHGAVAAAVHPDGGFVVLY